MKLTEIPVGKLVSKCETWNPRQSHGSFSYIDLSSVDKDTKSIAAVEEHDCSAAPSRARQLVRAGDILVATVRPNLNGVATVNIEHDGMTASTGYCVLRPIPEKIEHKYLFHWVKTPQFIQRMVDVASGANYPAVSDAKVKASKIPLPPLEEQKRIAGILDAADRMRAKRRETLAQLDVLLQSTFLELFGDPVTNPKGWEVKTLGESSNCVTDGTHQSPNWSETGLPFLFVGNIRDRQIDFETSKFISENEHERLTSRCPIEVGDVLYTTVGSYGNPAMVREGMGRFAFQRHIAHIKPKADLLDSQFLEVMLDSPVGRHQADRLARGVAQKTLNLRELKSFKILLPPLAEQRRFAAIVECVEKQKVQQRAHLAELDALFASLQSRAFNGEL